MKAMKLASVLWWTGCLFAVPATIGGMIRAGQQAQAGQPVDSAEPVYGFWGAAAVAYVLARGWAWWRSRRDRRPAEDIVGTVTAITVDDREDGRDAFRVSDDKGRLIFTVWAQPGLYAIGERLAMRQWVERA